jgi:hypothetical protein
MKAPPPQAKIGLGDVPIAQNFKRVKVKYVAEAKWSSEQAA